MTRTTAGTAPDMTSREDEVAALVAQGRTNRQIAAALFVSEKTVERHLSSIFRKLGVDRRAAVAATFVLRQVVRAPDR